MFLQNFPPMGVYETLFKFLDATGTYMGEPGTRPWAQGFPLTTQLPGGPELPSHVEFSSPDLKYPSATGVDPLRAAIRDYYNHFYQADIDIDNVAVFAGGRPGIFATLLFLSEDIEVLIEETEYTPYFDKLKLIQRRHTIIPSNPENNFRPTVDDYRTARASIDTRTLLVKSHPCNPTGVTWNEEQLKDIVEFASQDGNGAIFDEAYEFFNANGATSTLKHVRDIDNSNIFVIGAATKGLQVPGLRIGWVVASKQHVEIFRNFSSIAMGGVSRPSQICVTQMLEQQRVTQARTAVQNFFDGQRETYATGLQELGIELCSGDGGFYHWGKLPNELTANELNVRLFEHNAAILPGTLCDMHRRGEAGPHAKFIRFSFGPVTEESYDKNIKILKSCLFK